MGSGASTDIEAPGRLGLENIENALPSQNLGAALESAPPEAVIAVGAAVGGGVAVESAPSEAVNAVGAAVAEAGEEIVPPPVDVDSLIPETVDMIPEDCQPQVTELLEKARTQMSAVQFEAATSIFKATWESMPLAGAAVVAAAGAAVMEATDFAPEIMMDVTSGLCSVAGHLPFIAVATGVLGGIIMTFQQSKDTDENVKTVMVWSASIKDWLLLVAGKIEKAAAETESTLALFEALQESLLKLRSHLDDNNKRWRITKMLTSSSFKRSFDLVKQSVLELKNELYAFLDQKSQMEQEAKLAGIESQNLQTIEKLESMESQLETIRSYMEQQTAQMAEKEKNAYLDMQEEEQIYSTMQKGAGVGEAEEIPFNTFVLAFESFVLGGADMEPEVKRGLKICILKDASSTKVSKLHWIKFFRKWKDSGLPMEGYLDKIASEAPPTLWAQAKDTKATATKAANKALGTAMGTLKLDPEAARTALQEELQAKKDGLMGKMPKIGFRRKKEA